MEVEAIGTSEPALSFDPLEANLTQQIETIDALNNHDKIGVQEAINVHLAETKLRIMQVF